MAPVRKTITLTDQQDDWIRSQVQGGDHTNDSVVHYCTGANQQHFGVSLEADPYLASRRFRRNST
jgi:hypothetical protein